MGVNLDDGKKMNVNKKREKGVIYGVGINGITEFHHIENIPIKEFENQTVGVVIKSLQKKLNDLEILVEEKNSDIQILIQEKIVIIKNVLEHQDKDIKKIKKEMKKYGILD